MKKRMLLLGMAIWMAAALAGCGNDTTASTDQNTAADQEQSENATDKTQTDGSQTDANIEQAATGAPLIQMENQQKDWYSDDGSKWLMHAETQQLQVEIPGNDAAAQKINDWSEADASTFWENAEKTSEYAENDLESMSTVSGMEDLGTYSYYYSSFQSYNVMRADSQVISLRSYNNDYTGGIHGDYAYYGTTFDTMTGEELKIQDIVADMPSFRHQATKDIDKYLQENYSDGLFEDYQDTVEQIWEGEDGFNWYLNESGIMVIFNPYVVGPYAMGAVTVPLPYSSYASYLNPDYTTPETISAGNGELMEETVTKIRTSRLGGGAQQTENSDAAVAQTDSGNSDAAVAQTGSGNTPVNYGDLNVYMDQKNEFGGGTLTIELNEQKEQTEYFDRLCDSQILYLEDGRVFVLLVADHASDDYELFLYEVTDGKLKLKDQQDNLFIGDGSVSAGGRKNGMLMLKKNVNVFGSYQCSMTYSIGDDGKLVPDEEFFQVDIDNYPYSVLTVTRELPVSVNGGQTTLQTGTQIRITGTNDAGIALFETTDGKVSGEIHYTEPEGDSEFYHKINGITEDQYFESIPYAG